MTTKLSFIFIFMIMSRSVSRPRPSVERRADSAKSTFPIILLWGAGVLMELELEAEAEAAEAEAEAEAEAARDDSSSMIERNVAWMAFFTIDWVDSLPPFINES